MMDVNGALLPGASITTGTEPNDHNSNDTYKSLDDKSRWSSVSSAETDLDNFWHDSVCLYPLINTPG